MKSTSKALLKPLTVAICSAAVLSTALPALSQATALQPRITAPVDNSVRSALAGSHPMRAAAANDVGAVSQDMKLQGISIVLGRSAAQQTALNTLLAAQQNAGSPLFHHWLTPDQFAAQFGAAPADVATVESWLEQQGFGVDSVSRSRDRIFFSGTAGQVALAFEAPLHYYKTPAIGNKAAVTHFAPSTDLTIPSALAPSVISVDNLTDFHPHSHFKMQPAQLQPSFTVSNNQAYFLTPPDVDTIYDVTPAINQGYNGSGQTIAVVGQSAVVTSDITTFQTVLGLTAKAPGINLVPGSGTSTVVSGDETESDLDLEYSSAMAPGATVNFYYTGNSPNYGVFDSLQYVVDNDLAPVISISYGDCEFDTTSASIAAFDSEVLEKAAAQGETVVASAGDDGSSDCAEDTNLTFAQQTALAVDYPSSSPYVTGMGGTEFPVADVTPTNTTYWTSAGNSDLISSAITYIPEIVWNDDAADLAYAEKNKVNPISAGGGGESLYEVRPYWQTGVSGIPSGTTRLVPDLSLAASPNYPGFLFCSSDTKNTGVTGSCTNGFRDTADTGVDVAGGTSFDAPIFSGLLAILNQAKGYTTGQGVINPTLYTMAGNATTYASAFHDITSGGNECNVTATYCGTGAQTTDYVSTAGYDVASGLGSIDFNNLLTAWTAPGTTSTPPPTPSFSVTAGSITVAPGATGSGTITISPGTSGYTGTVDLTLNSSSFAGCVSLSSTSVAVSSSSGATATYSVLATAAPCPTAAVKLGSQLGNHNAASLHPGPRTPNSPWKRLPIPAALAGTFLICCSRRRSSLLRAGMALGLLLMLSFSGLSLTGCGGSSSTTTTKTNDAQPGTYTVTVTGTDSKTSTITSTASFTITVS